MIKKYKFLFILLFGLFVFLPKDTFAMDITFFGSNYTNLRSCNDCQYLSGVDGSFVNNVLAVQIVYDDYNLIQGYKYEIETTFNLATPSNPAYRTPLLFYGDASRDITQKFYSINSENNDVGIAGVKRLNIGYIGEFTADVTVNDGSMIIEYYFQNPISIFYFDVVQYHLKALGDTTGDAINNSTNTIVQNNNKNTDKIVQGQEEIKDTINDSDVSDAEESASGFFNDFASDDFGLSSIITMPLQFIEGLSSSTCYSLNLPLPFVDTNVTLPCMTSIYQRYFGDFLALYQIITTGFIAYGVCINIFRLVQGFKNPDNDNVEVMEL